MKRAAVLLLKAVLWVSGLAAWSGSAWWVWQCLPPQPRTVFPPGEFVAWSDDGSKVATLLLPTKPEWNPELSEGLFREMAIKEQPGTLRRNARGSLFGTSEATFRVWDLTTAEIVGAITTQCFFTESASPVFSSDLRFLAHYSAPKDPKDWRHSIEVWDVAAGQRIEEIAPPPGSSWTLRFSPNGELLAYGAGRTIRLWDVQERKERAALDLRDDLGWSAYCAFSPDGTVLASPARKDEDVMLWDARTGNLTATIPSHRSSHEMPSGPQIAISPRRRFFASVVKCTRFSSIDSIEVKIWDVTTRKELSTGRWDVRTWHDSQWTLEFGAQDTALVSTGSRASPHALMHPLDHGASSFAWHISDAGATTRIGNGHWMTVSPDGSRIAFAQCWCCGEERGHGRLRVVDVATHTELAQWVPPGFEESDTCVYPMRFSPDGKTLAVLVRDMGPLWRRAAGEHLRSWHKVRRFLDKVWLPRRAIWLLDSSTLEVQAKLTTPDDGLAILPKDRVCSPLPRAVFTPDGKSLAASITIDGEERIAVWDLPLPNTTPWLVGFWTVYALPFVLIVGRKAYKLARARRRSRGHAVAGPAGDA